MPFLPADHPPVAHGRTGVLLINLGTPAAPTRAAVARYLAEFLTDRRVIELPWPLRQLLVRAIIAPVRAGRSAKLYARVWDRERNGSPLALITQDQTAALQERFKDRVMVRHAMRYGQPAIDEQIKAMRAVGCDRLLIAPLYPQYCAATTATAFDAVARTLQQMRWQPSVRTLPPYFDHPAHIEALGVSVEAHLATLDWQPEIILQSFHGMPRVTLDKGDPYHCQCVKTARLLAARLGQGAATMPYAFQSRFGRQTWLQPYSATLVAELAQRGVRKLAVVAPGFAADCLETLDEIRHELGTLFRSQGGTHFSYIPCLNTSVAGIDMLHHFLVEQLHRF